jgi:CRP-like cAMP-binding protein
MTAWSSIEESEQRKRNFRTLRACALFASMADDDLGSILEDVRRLSVRRQNMILPAGSRERGLFIVESGAARLYTSANSRELTLRRFGPGDVFGLMLLSEETEHTSHLEAVSDTAEILFIPWRALDGVVGSHPDVAYQALRLAGPIIQHLADLARDIAIYDTMTRLAHVLARLAQEAGDSCVGETHSELAALIGGSQGEVTRALGTFERQGLVARTRRRPGIRVLDPEALAGYESRYR